MFWRGTHKTNQKARVRSALLIIMGLIAGITVGTGASFVGPQVAQADRPTGGVDNQNNPDLAASCGTDVIVILDESGSVSSFETQLETAALALADGLIGTGSRMRFVEFNGLARNAQITPVGGTQTDGFLEVDDDYRAGLNNYLTGSGSSSGSTSNNDSYNPGGVTNWESALWRAWAPASDLPEYGGATGAPLVVFITDGDPNTIGRTTQEGSNTGSSSYSDFARDRAIDEIEEMQDDGAHVLSIAVGNGISNDTSYGRLTNLTEPNLSTAVPPADQRFFSDWQGTGDLDIRTVDVLKVADFAKLDDALRLVVYGLCAPSLQLTKFNQGGEEVENWPFSVTVESLDNAGAAETSMQWVSPSEATPVAAPQTRTLQTGDDPGNDPVSGPNADGQATFQWTPNSVADPKPWSSEVTFTETLPPGWTIDPSTYAANNNSCEVQRLTTDQNDDTVVETFNVSLEKLLPAGVPRPGETVKFGFKDGTAAFSIDKADIVFCDIKNNEPATITIEKEIDALDAQTSADFSFTTTSPTNPAADPGLPPTFPITGVTEAAPQSETFTVEAGTYTVRETEQTPWELTSLNCTGSGSSGPTDPADPRARSITVGAGQDITCTFANRETPAPDVTITKNVDKDEIEEIGTDTVRYTVELTNNNLLDDVKITKLDDVVTVDPADGSADLTDTWDLLDPAETGGLATTVGLITANTCPAQFTNSPTAGNDILAADSSRSCTFDVQYTARNAFDQIRDTVELTAVDQFDRPTDPTPLTADEVVDVTDIRPTLLVDKQNKPVGDPATIDFVAPNDTATYTIKVTNTSPEPVTVTDVTDRLFAGPTNDFADASPYGPVLDITTTNAIVTATSCGLLQPGLVIPANDGAPGGLDEFPCEITIDTSTLPALAGGSFIFNDVSVSVIDDDTEDKVTASDDAGREVLTEPGDLSVFKTDDKDITEPGSRVTFTLQIQNATVTEDITITEVQDDLSFTPNGQAKVSIGSFLVDSATPPTFSGPGATLVSTTCTGVIGLTLETFGSTDPTTGDPTDRTSCQFVLDLEGNALDVHSDVATVRGELDDGTPVEDENEATTPVVGAPPVISVTKDASVASVPETGGPVTFTFEVTNNSGATDPVTLTSFSDDKLGDLFGTPNANVTANTCAALEDSTKPGETPGPIAPGASVTCTVTATLTGEPGVDHVNIVSVQGIDDEGVNTNLATATETVKFDDVPPTIDVTKTAVDGNGDPLDPKTVLETGENVTFLVEVENTSDETVWITSLTDSDYGDITKKAPENAAVIDTTCALGNPAVALEGIAAGDTYDCTFTALVKRSAGAELQHENTVTAVAVDNDDTSTPPTQDSETIPFELIPPTVEITKTDNDASVAEPGGVPGGNVTYFLEIENTSNEPITITKLEDEVNYQKPAGSFTLDLLTDSPAAPLVSSTCDPVEIAAGETYPCQFVLTLTGTAQLVDDEVTVIAEDNDAAAGRVDPATDTATDNTPITDVAPTVEIDKTANPTQVKPGEDVTYTYTIFNRSTFEDITLVSLEDDKFTFGPTECAVTGTPGDPADGLVLTPDDGNDASGTDQTTCQITRSNLLPETGDNPLNFDHKNTVKVEAADDEILGSEDPIYVSDDDDAVVQVRETDVQLDKSDAVVTPNGNGTYQAVYTITVENDGAAGTYRLDDEFRFGPGITVVGDPAVEVVPNTIALTADFDGDTQQEIASGVAIAAGPDTEHVYTITVNVAADVQPDDVTYVDCKLGDTSDEGTGLLNVASVSVDGGTPITDDGCGDVPAIEFEKSDPVVTANGDGTYDAVYTITADNTGAAGEYTLTDTYGFFDGVTVIETTVGVDPNTVTLNGGFDGDSDKVVAADVAIAADTTHTYTLTVKVSVDVSGDQVVYTECSTTTTPGTGEGLFNEASISVDGGPEVIDDACGDLPGDLQIEKTDGGVTAILGGAPFTYTLTVSNVGGLDTGTPVTVTDVLPAEFEWVSFPNTVGDLPFCVQTDQTLVCDVDPALVDRGGKSTTIEVTAKARAGIAPSVDGYENLSYVDSPGDPAPETPECPIDEIIVDRQPADLIDFLDDPGAAVQQVAIGGNVSNNVACDETPVIDGEIEVSKTDDVADPDLVINGQEFTYTLNVKNVGSSPVDTVKLTDDLPADIELVSVNAGAGWTCNAVDPVECSYAPDLASGETTTDVVLTVKVSDAFIGTQIDNEVTSTAIVRTDGDSKTVTDTDDEVTPLEPTLDVGAFVPVCIADAPAIQYTIVPKGFVPGTDTATLEVLDVNGDRVDYNGDGVVNDDDLLLDQPLSGSILWPGAEVVDGVTVDWPGWRLVNGLWEMDPSDDFLRDGVFVAVSVNPEATTDLIEYPPSTSACADPEQTSADVQIVKTASADTVEQGDPVSWDLVVTNNGPDLATDVVVTDTVPSQLTVTAVTSSDFSCNNSGNAITCTRSELAVGASGTITIQTTVNNGVEGLVSNTATVTGRQPDPDPSNNTFTDSIDVPEVIVLPPEPPPVTLPETGSNVNSIIAIAMTLLMAGFALVLSTVKRRRHTI